MPPLLQERKERQQLLVMEKTRTNNKKPLATKATNRMVTKVRKMELLKMAVKMEKKHMALCMPEMRRLMRVMLRRL